MTLPIPSSTTVTTRPTTARSASQPDVSVAQTDAAQEEQRTQSVSEVFSQRQSTLRKASRSLLSKLNAADESRKAAARQRIEQMKERIKMLKMLAASGLATKGVLREIRLLAQELGQAAQVLKGGSSNSSASTDAEGGDTLRGDETKQLVSESTGAEGSDEPSAADAEPPAANLESDDEADASAEEEDSPEESAADAKSKTQAQSAQHEASSLGAYLRNQDETDARQRRQDAELVKDVLSRLKALLELVKKNVDLGDTESRKELQQINKLMSDTADIAADMGGGILGGLSIGGMVSISV